MDEDRVESTSEHEEFKRVDTSQSQNLGEYNGKNGNSKPLLLLLGLIVLLAIGATGYLLRDRFTKVEPTPTPTQVLETPQEKPTPTPSFERSKYIVKVLNGTKTAGLAASVSAKLKDLGYQVGKTGNATNSAFEKTIIKVKPDLSELSTALLEDLKAEYSADTGPNLKDNDTSDAEVILGVK